MYLSSLALAEYFVHIFASRDAVVGVLSFDKLSMGTKFGTLATTCIPNKPNKYGIRMCRLSSAGVDYPTFFIPLPPTVQEITATNPF